MLDKLNGVIDYVQDHDALLQFVKFCVVGATCAVVDGGLFYTFHFKAHIPWMLARSMSFTVAVINGFVWNRMWTFKAQHAGSRQSQFVKFFGINIVGLALNLAIMKFMYFVQLGHAPTAHQQDKRQTAIAFLVAITIVSVWNFLGSKFWSFKAVEGRMNEPVVEPNR